LAVVVARISMEFLQGGKESVITFDMENLASHSDTVATAMLTNIRTGWVTYIRPLVSPDLVLQQVKYNIPFTEVVLGGTSAGTLSGLAMPPNVAILVQKITVGAPKGRFFHPGVGTGQANSAGVINAGHLTNWQLAVDNWLTAINADAAGVPNEMVVKNKLGGTTPVVDLNVKGTVSTQRRRLD
jgi:hypothetical protein